MAGTWRRSGDVVSPRLTKTHQDSFLFSKHPCFAASLLFISRALKKPILTTFAHFLISLMEWGVSGALPLPLSHTSPPCLLRWVACWNEHCHKADPISVIVICTVIISLPGHTWSAICLSSLIFFYPNHVQPGHLGGDQSWGPDALLGRGKSWLLPPLMARSAPWGASCLL